MGGYRKGSGRSKSGYYNGIYCGSTYELCWVIHSLDHDIGFSRFHGKLEKDGVAYYPDFLLNNGITIVETKGYESQESVERKNKVAESFGYNVKVLRKEDLKYAFDYVSTQYKTKKFYELYDGYCPTYTYICDFCKDEYASDRNIKTSTKFCSRKCAGKYSVYRKNKNSIDVKNGKYKRQLDKQTALEIFHRTDKSLQGLAEEYNIAKNNIWFIKQKKTYKWIHD
jgi:hypothetical protein